MAHGTPDWGHSKTTTVYPLVTDLAELAARLGSIDTYDRRGNVSYMDDFTHGKEAWHEITTGSGAAIELSTTAPQWGANHLKLTGGSDSTRLAQVSRYLAVPVLSSVGLEFGVCFPTSWSNFRISIRYDDGTDQHRGGITLSDQADKIYYLDDAGANQEVDDLIDLISLRNLYHQVKLVVDLSGDTYVRLMLDQTTYDLSDYALYTATSAAEPRLFVWLEVESRAAQNDYVYIDGVIITHNEP